MSKTFTFIAVASNVLAGLAWDGPLTMFNFIIAGFIAGIYTAQLIIQATEQRK